MANEERVIPYQTPVIAHSQSTRKIVVLTLLLLRRLGLAVGAFIMVFCWAEGKVPMDVGMAFGAAILAFFLPPIHAGFTRSLANAA